MDQQSIADIPWQATAAVAGATALLVIRRLGTRPARRRRRKAEGRAMSPERREARRRPSVDQVREPGGEAGDGGEFQPAARTARTEAGRGRVTP